MTTRGTQTPTLPTARRSRLHGIVFHLLLSVAARTPSAWALECDSAICQGNPCTITGTHRLVADCELDFSGKDVTIAPNASIIWPVPGTNGWIFARNLTVRGSIQAFGGGFELNTEENLTTVRSPGEGKIVVSSPAAGTYSGYPAYLDIYAGSSGMGAVTLSGSIVLVSGAFDTSVYIEAPSISVDSRLVAENHDPGPGEDNVLSLTATAGTITTTKKITVKSEGAFGTFPAL